MKLITMIDAMETAVNPSAHAYTKTITHISNTPGIMGIRVPMRLSNSKKITTPTEIASKS
jgi:hypothetical protein